MPVRVGTLIVLVLSLSCSDTSVDYSADASPQGESKDLSPGQPSAVVDSPLGDRPRPVPTVQQPPQVQRPLQELTDFDTLYTLGALESPRREVFGFIADLAVDRHRRLYVLDARYKELRVFDSAGAHLTTTGRPGKGPGEFSSPESLAILDASTLAVADRNQRVSVFGWTDTDLSFVNSFRVALTPESVCSSSGNLVIHGSVAWIPDMFHVYSVTGDSLYSFGAPADADHLIVQETLSWGSIDCSNDLLAYLPDSRGLLQLFQLSTRRLIAETKLSGYRPVEYEIDYDIIEQGLAKFEWFSPEGTDTGAFVQVIDDGNVIVQVARRDTSDTAPGDYSALFTHLFSPRARFRV